MAIDLEVELDRLYSLPLGEFVAFRNELTKRLRAEGEREAATRVKGLSKPSLTAWAVNQLAAHHSSEMQALAEAGAKVRAAHLSAPADQQEAAKARRAVISSLLRLAAALFTEAGLSFGRQHRQRVSRTLEALSGQDSDDEPRAGRLSRDLEPQGFDALSGLAAALEQAQKNRPQRTVVLPFEKPARSRPKLVEKPAAESKKTEVPAENDDSAEAEAAAVEAAAKAATEAAAEAQRQAARRELDHKITARRQAVETLEQDRADRKRQLERAKGELQQAEASAESLADAATEAERVASEARRQADAAVETALQAAEAKASTETASTEVEEQLEREQGELQTLEEERQALD